MHEMLKRKQIHEDARKMHGTKKKPQMHEDARKMCRTKIFVKERVTERERE